MQGGWSACNLPVPAAVSVSVPTREQQSFPRVVALVPAAGRGLRMGGRIPKQFLQLGGVPILVHSLRVLQASPTIHEIILAVPQAERQYCLDHVLAGGEFGKVTKVVAGGAQRQDSVRHALSEVGSDCEIVLVHDAVRPFLTEDMVRGVVAAAVEHGAAIIALPMRDTVKSVGSNGVIERTVDRGPLWLAQTPQAFRREWLAEAHRKGHLSGSQATDDAHLVELIGKPVVVVEGSGENIKVTRPEDLVIGEAILGARAVRRDG
ncbi:MAG: 2-C-methyl-D-erythritol 4-phosphate cytidylyltransferase [Nitrospirae bacterium]|nr:MAG: 2-C-methyl-D-erythritol 4-phosphate cytidylyltransferase [Nitrospira sp. OLB3]MBV6470210.1 2-C-methyl-D-erythritol 4-phosphate cytidylyltransferase [Nitrospirota bacterium]